MKFSNMHKSKLAEGFSALLGLRIALLKTQTARLHPQNIWFSRPGMSLRFSQVPDAAGLGLHLENTWTSVMNSYLPCFEIWLYWTF